MDKKKNNSSTIGGVVFVGFMFIGLAMGMLYNNTAVGILLGLGVGFVAMGIVWAIASKSDSADKN